MIASLLEFSLRQSILVIGLACMFSVAGLFAFQSKWHIGYCMLPETR